MEDPKAALKRAVLASPRREAWSPGKRFNSKSWTFPLETGDGHIRVWPVEGGFQIVLEVGGKKSHLTNCATAASAIESAERFAAGTYPQA